MILASFPTILEKIANEGGAHPRHLFYGVRNDADLIDMNKLEAFAAGVESPYPKML